MLMEHLEYARQKRQESQAARDLLGLQTPEESHQGGDDVHAGSNVAGARESRSRPISGNMSVFSDGGSVLSQIVESSRSRDRDYADRLGEAWTGLGGGIASLAAAPLAALAAQGEKVRKDRRRRERIETARPVHDPDGQLVLGMEVDLQGDSDSEYSESVTGSSYTEDSRSYTSTPHSEVSERGYESWRTRTNPTASYRSTPFGDSARTTPYHDRATPVDDGASSIASDSTMSLGEQPAPLRKGLRKAGLASAMGAVPRKGMRGVQHGSRQSPQIPEVPEEIGGNGDRGCYCAARL